MKIDTLHRHFVSRAKTQCVSGTYDSGRCIHDVIRLGPGLEPGEIFVVVVLCVICSSLSSHEL